MSNKIYIKRSVKEKLPEKEGQYFMIHRSGFLGAVEYSIFKDGKGRFHQNRHFIKSVDNHWLEEVPLEEYLKEIGYLVL